MRLPRLLCLLWLVFLGFAIWGKASQSTQPAIYDAAEYYRKAREFWGLVSEHHLFNPFNIPPTLRPPGTLLMSYPLGFVRDFRPLYFRSVYFPVVLTALAAYLVALPAGEWAALVVAVFMSAMPGFYHFEWPDTLGGVGYWGLVDAFLAAVAALAMACAVHSVRCSSRRFLWLAAMLSAFCLLIKPSGMVVMALFTATWLLLSAGMGNRYRLHGAGAIALIYVITCAVCVSTAYLSPGQIDWESRSFSNYRDNHMGLAGEPLSAIPSVVAGRTYACFGAATLILLAIPFGLRQRPRYALAALAVLAMGCIFCLRWGGLQQFRYFLVFGLMASILCLPLVMQLVDTLPPPARRLLAWLALLPPLGLAVALLQTDPSVALQRALGADVVIGRTRQAEQAVRTLVAEASRNPDVPTLYSMSYFLPADGPFADPALLSPEPNREPFVTVKDTDPFRPFVIRMQDLMTADYILCPFMENQLVREDILRHPSIPTFEQEETALASWLTDSGPHEGVSTVATMPGARLLHVARPTLFESSLQDFVSRHQWRPLFYQENPSHWLLESDVQQNSDIVLDNAIHIRRLTVEHKPNLMQVKVFWQHVAPTARKYTLSMEARTESNALVSQAFIRLTSAAPPDELHVVRMDTSYLNVPSGENIGSLVLILNGVRWSVSL